MVNTVTSRNKYSDSKIDQFDHSNRFIISTQGTIVPTANFNGERGAIKLQKAMKGLGSDEKVIIEVLTSHSNAQRQEIKKKYKALYGRNLSDDIRGELGGLFEELCLALLAPYHEYLADCIRIAVKNGGGSGQELVEILAPLQSNEAAAIANIYQEKFQTTIESEIQEDWLKDLVISLLSEAGSDDDSISAQTDADRLKQDISDGDLESVTNILRSRRKDELRAAFDLYEGIDEDVKGLLTSSDGKLVYLYLIQIVRNECDYFAERLNSCFRGLDSDDATLIRVITTHSETNLSEIKERYRVLYGKELTEAVSDDTSGDYRKLLLKILG
ncbi:Annexin A6 [Chamberlinius hualienensis]